MHYNKIYVICPYGLVTGGADALHQLVYYMNLNNIDAKIVYSDITKKNKEIPTPYKVYINDYLVLKDIKDEENSAIISPETLICIAQKYKNLDKYIWWLSVKNNSEVTKGNKFIKIIKKVFSLSNLKKIYKIRTLKYYIHNKKFDFNDKSLKHLCASYYAKDYVEKNNSSCELLIEPISKYFLNNYKDEYPKEDVVLYNPKKNYQFTKKILQNSKSENIKFIKLSGYNQQQLIDLYSKSKLYIDFGSFPGAERIPKEAVLCGCAIITGKNGASTFYNDVVVEDEYKIESKDENIDSIIEKIMYCLHNYDNIKKDFDNYRNVVLKLEENFIKQINEYFK